MPREIGLHYANIFVIFIKAYLFVDQVRHGKNYFHHYLLIRWLKWYCSSAAGLSGSSVVIRLDKNTFTTGTDDQINTYLHSLLNTIQTYRINSTEDQTNTHLQLVLKTLQKHSYIWYPRLDNKKIVTSATQNNTNTHRHLVPYSYLLHSRLDKYKFTFAAKN